jgi:formate dehydrogenase major subunit
MILMTGRRLEHYNAGTMTRRTANLALLPTERMDLHPAGDDLGDLSAFAAAFELKARGGDVLRVAVDSAEAPAHSSTRPTSSLTGRRDCWSSFGD